MWASGRSTRVDVDADCQRIKSISYLNGFIPKHMLWASWPDTGTVSTQPDFSHECISGMDWIHQILRTAVCEVMCNNTVICLQGSFFKYGINSRRSDAVCTSKTHCNGCVVCVVTTATLFSTGKIQWAVAQNEILAMGPSCSCLLSQEYDPFHFSKQICRFALLLPAQNWHWSPFFSALPCSS